MIRCILVPLDHTTFAEGALVPSVMLARTLGARLDIALVHQQPKLANLRRSNWNSAQLEQEARYLERIEERIAVHGVTHSTHAVLEGEIEDAIIERARAVSADLIVMASHGATGLSRARLGSVAYSLVHDSGLPVLVVREDKPGQSARAETMYQRILVPIDGSEESNAVLPAAMEVAKFTNSTLVLLRVVEPVPMFGTFSPADFATGPHPFMPGSIQDIAATERVCVKARIELARTAAALADATVPNIEAHVIVATRTSGAILDYATATGVDLIAMATHGWGGSRWVLGSVADAVLRSSKLPLLLSRPAGKAGPSPASEFERHVVLAEFLPL